MEPAMKNIILKTATICFLAFSASAFAEKITITGEPVTLEKRGDIYVVPDTYKPTQTYQYVMIDGTKRACFLDKRPDFVNLDVVSINVQVGADKATWNCYATDPTYFVIEGK
jgi:hypothetical protein